MLLDSGAELVDDVAFDEALSCRRELVPQRFRRAVDPTRQCLARPVHDRPEVMQLAPKRLDLGCTSAGAGLDLRFRGAEAFLDRRRQITQAVEPGAKLTQRCLCGVDSLRQNLLDIRRVSASCELLDAASQLLDAARASIAAYLQLVEPRGKGGCSCGIGVEATLHVVQSTDDSRDGFEPAQHVVELASYVFAFGRQPCRPLVNERRERFLQPRFDLEVSSVFAATCSIRAERPSRISPRTSRESRCSSCSTRP